MRANAVFVWLFLLSTQALAFTAGENMLSMSDAASIAVGQSEIGIAFPQLSPFFTAERARLSSGELYGGTQFQKLSYERPGRRAFAAELSHMQSASSDVTDELGAAAGSFSQEETFMRLSASGRSGRAAAAVSYGFMSQRIYNSVGRAHSADAAFSYYPAGIKIKGKDISYAPFGVSLWAQNIAASSLNTGSSSEKMPKNVHLFENLNLFGGTFSLFFRQSVMDITLRKEKKAFYGSRICLSRQIFLMAGKSASETALGASVRPGRFALSVAAASTDAGTRFIASVSFDFSYERVISEKIIKEKNLKISGLKKQLKNLEYNSGALTENERKWVTKMAALARESMKQRDFRRTAEIINEMSSRYGGGAGTEPEKRLTKEEARGLVARARELFEFGDYEKAKKTLTPAMSTLTGDPYAEETGYLINAGLKIKEGKYLQARSILAEGLVIKPDSVEIMKLMKRIEKYIKITEEKKD